MEKALVKPTQPIHSNTGSKMATTMTTTLFEYLQNHKANAQNKLPSTNTRIGDKDMQIFGANYHIPEEEYKLFLDLYYQEVFQRKKPEYLTEKQLDKNGPILIDIDLHFDLNIKKRIYTDDHIEDLLTTYLAKLKNFFEFDDDSKFQIYVFEKKTINRVIEKQMTKDGIHIIIGIQTDHITQQLLRKAMIRELPDIWRDIPIKNESSWEGVMDDGISKGHINWQLYGSRKPNHEPYILTKVYDITYDSDNETLDKAPFPMEEFSIKDNLYNLSARCKTHPEFFYKNSFVSLREEAIKEGMCNPSDAAENRKNRNQPANANASSTFNAMTDLTMARSTRSIFQVKCKAELDEVVNQFLDDITKGNYDYELREAYDYTMILPISYYGEGSYSKWIRVGWALRNISDLLFIAWVAFSAQSSSFNYSDIIDLHSRWLTFDLGNPNGLTKRSIMHWAKTDAKDKYKKTRETSIDHYIEQTLVVSPGDLDEDGKATNKPKARCGEYDIALVLYHLCKDDYVCASIESNLWYTYKKNRWVKDAKGYSLRNAISNELRELYRKKSAKIMDQQCGEDNERVINILKVKNMKALAIWNRLSCTTDKNNLMTEARDLFFDDQFMEKLDANPYLLGFANGVVDFKEKVFRRGYPEDYLSMSTKFDYRPIDRVRDSRIIAEIQDFMRKLFPIPELHDYMWEHLASVMIGTNLNQTFNMYIGVGQNGKSILINLMEALLGDYINSTVPLSLVTGDRPKMGQSSSEIAKLKGIRYAVMQEPSKGDKINEGPMKQLTGDDNISGRFLFQEPITFKPQFKLVVCSNEYLEVKGQTHGTWRRIRVVDFKSLFVENPEHNDPDKPYQFKIDKTLKNKFGEWKEVFAAMLIEKAYETQGEVKECAIVMNSSNEYRKSQDCMAEFISDRLATNIHSTLKKETLKQEFHVWYQGNYGNSGEPKPKELFEYMDKKYGKYDINKCWKGVCINYDFDDNVVQTHTNTHEAEEEFVEVDDDFDMNAL